MYMRLRTSSVLTSLLVTATVLLVGPVLSQPIFAESSQNEVHVTPVQICDYSGCFYPNPNIGTGVCQDMYGYIYRC